jgi:peptide/nickel transport system permease protein
VSLRFLIRRFVFLVLTLLGATVLVFLLSYAAPGDPARAALGIYASEESVAHYRAERGLDRPLVVQYVIYMRHLFRGDLGDSILSDTPVVTELRQSLPATIELMVPSLVFATVVGMGLGVLGARYVNRWPDHISRLVAVFGMAMPPFWLGVLLQLIFYRWLGWLPIGRRLSPVAMAPPTVTGLITVDALIAGDYDVFVQALSHLVLPAFTLSVVDLATLARVSRSTLLDVLHQQYIQVAHSKGLSERIVLMRHAMRNALIPLVTLIGLMIGRLIGGAIIVENIFAWPGLGRRVVNSLIHLDRPMVAGFALLMGVTYGMSNLLVDVMYQVLDPRVKGQS